MRKYSGVLGMAILSIVSALVVALNYKGLNYTVSNHSAANLASTVGFCVFGTIGALLIGYSLLVYVPQKWDVGKGYRQIAGVFALAFVVTCMYPNDPSVVTLHDIGAWGIVFSEFALMVFFLFRLWGQYGGAARVGNALFVVILVGMSFVALFENDFLWKYILVFEPGIIAMVFVLELFLILGKPKDEAGGSLKDGCRQQPAVLRASRLF